MDQIEVWQAGLYDLLARMSGVFANRVGLARLGLYARELLGPAECKNGWQLAEEAGEATPCAMQQFLFRGNWFADELSRDMRRYIIGGLATRWGSW
ncbi:hypothetical protein DCC79_00460 [bacterium]|nr:hypothetical protein [Chloroflexi bacterium CFX6]RIL12734.1 MAG: hypothetical protein DCC79_00460 [bacterium]